MGNCLLNVCPIATIRFSSWPSVITKSLESVEDTALLHTSTTDTPTNANEEALVVDNGPPSNNPPVQYMKPTKILKRYTNFPFLKDDEIASWILYTRFMFIMRGPSGSGKSYVAECIRARFPNTKICSADNFWYLDSDGQEYQFDRSRLHEAHQWCQSLAFEAAQTGTSPIVIDNTNIRVWEVSKYTKLARQFGYTVIMVSAQTPWRFDTEALAMRSVHFVSDEVVESMVRNFEPIFPVYYGLLWPGLGAKVSEDVCASQMPPLDIDGKALMDWAWDAFTTLLGLPDVRLQLANVLGLSDTTPLESILEHWQSATTPAFGCDRLKSCRKVQSPHVTMRYAGNGWAPGAQYYGLSEVVSSSLLGRLFTVQVTGLFVSLRTVGIRVRLPLHDPVLRQLWAEDDQAELHTVDQNNSQIAAAGVDRPRRTSRPVGCRAHVTLALSPGVTAKETGLDLLRVVDAELAGRPGEHVAVLPRGSVRRVIVQQPASSPTDQTNGGEPSPPPPCCIPAPPDHEYVYVLDLESPQHHRVIFAGVY